MAKADEAIKEMSELQKYIVLLLSANNNEPIKAATKFQMEVLFQKELFLLAKNIKVLEEQASFGSDFYGPYSETAQEELEELEMENMLIKEKSMVCLSEFGSQIAKSIEKKTSNDILEMISEFKSLINDMNEDEVLTFIYFTFPEFTDESLVLKEIKKNRKLVALKLYKKEKVSLQRAAEIAGEPLERFIRDAEK